MRIVLASWLLPLLLHAQESTPEAMIASAAAKMEAKEFRAASAAYWAAAKSMSLARASHILNPPTCG